MGVFEIPTGFGSWVSDQGFPGRIQDSPYVDMRDMTVLREPPLIPCNSRTAVLLTSIVPLLCGCS